jgi:hypothetical protein
VKAIIISDTEARALLEQLELKKLQECGHYRGSTSHPEAVEEAHRMFHYVVCRWLQEMGASTVR